MDKGRFAKLAHRNGGVFANSPRRNGEMDRPEGQLQGHSGVRRPFYEWHIPVGVFRPVLKGAAFP